MIMIMMKKNYNKESNHVSFSKSRTTKTTKIKEIIN